MKRSRKESEGVKRNKELLRGAWRSQEELGEVRSSEKVRRKSHEELEKRKRKRKKRKRKK